MPPNADKWRSVGRIPAKVFESDRAMVTAGLANDAAAVNQEAAVMYRPSDNSGAIGPQCKQGG
jgi:hypothetical protein